jgi:hypothetical protein
MGLRYLAVLLRRPGDRVPARDIVAAAHQGPPPEDDRESAADDRAAERARLTVTKGLKNALLRIAAVHPSLGSHLHVTIRRGYDCAYTPDPRHPIMWGE